MTRRVNEGGSPAQPDGVLLVLVIAAAATFMLTLVWLLR